MERTKTPATQSKPDKGQNCPNITEHTRATEVFRERRQERKKENTEISFSKRRLRENDLYERQDS
ncbi:MAG TPA: hypothetical protein VGB56_09820 [Flavisolibacter sp.]